MKRITIEDLIRRDGREPGGGRAKVRARILSVKRIVQLSGNAFGKSSFLEQRPQRTAAKRLNRTGGVKVKPKVPGPTVEVSGYNQHGKFRKEVVTLRDYKPSRTVGAYILGLPEKKAKGEGKRRRTGK